MKYSEVSLNLGYMICQPQWVEGKIVHVEFVANFPVKIPTKTHEVLQKIHTLCNEILIFWEITTGMLVGLGRNGVPDCGRVSLWPKLFIKK